MANIMHNFKIYRKKRLTYKNDRQDALTITIIEILTTKTNNINKQKTTN